ncbi:MAG: putative Ig domain-containing protein [Planctomycetes bacterium]|nr:putative Ig domain-containing protein [Planctomycetota bacterium]
MRIAILLLIAATLSAPAVFSQTVTRAWGEQIMLDYSGNPSAMDWGPNRMWGYEFQVAGSGVIPEVVELGCALPVANWAAALPGWQVTGGTARVALWEVTSATTGIRLAHADVPANANWGWVTLPQAIPLTPGSRYRVVVITGVTTTVTDPSNNVYNFTDGNMYFVHHTSNPPLVHPSGPIQYTGIVESTRNYNNPPDADISTFPDNFSPGTSYAPWGMADIAWREIETAPTLNAPTTGKDAPGVLITEAGPDVIPAGHEGGELQNVSNRWIDISNWRICIWDSTEAISLAQSQYDPVAIGTIPPGTSLAPDEVFTFGETVAGGAFDLAFGAWGWASGSRSAVVLLDANDKVIDVMRVNDLNLNSITNPVSGLSAHWNGSHLSQWNTTNSWQRQGVDDSDFSADWTRGNAQSVGLKNSIITTPFSNAGEKFASLNGGAPAHTGRLEVGDNLEVTFTGDDVNAGDTLTLSIAWTGGLTPAQAGFTNVTASVPATATGSSNISLTLTGTALAAGSIDFDVTITDSTSRSAIVSYTLTIDPMPNYAPRLSASYDVGGGRQNITSPATFGSLTQPVPFGMPLSSYAFQFGLVDGNGDAMPVTATMQVSPASTCGMTSADFEHGTQAVPYGWSPAAQAVFTHMNSQFTTFTVTLSANDGNGGTAQLVINFVVEPQPQNAKPFITVSRGGSVVANNSSIVIAPGTPLSGLNLRIELFDVEFHSVELTASISNLTTQGLLVSEFESGGFMPTGYTLTPGSGSFSVPSVTHRVDLTADDNHWQGVTTFTFYFVVNLPPSITVSSNGANVPNGSTIRANYLDTLASLGIQISVNDPDATPVGVGAVITGVTTQGILGTEFSAAQQAVAYVLSPASGVFNDPAGSSHAVTLTGTDLHGAQFVFNFSIGANPFAPSLEVRETGGAVIGNGAQAGGGRDFGVRGISSGPTGALDISVLNTGSGPIDLTSVALSGANAADFVLTAVGFPTQVFPGSPYTFQVAFDPNLGGTKQGVITLALAVAGTPASFTFEVAGIGHDPNGVVVSNPATLPDAVNGQPFGPYQLIAVGGVGTHTWSLFDGNMPYGFSLSPQGELSGTPAPDPVSGVRHGTFTFTVRVTDAQGGTGEQTLSITVLGATSAGAPGNAGCTTRTGRSTALLGLLALVLLVGYRRRRLA